jgi:phosphohistidine phosphatase
MPAVTPQDPPSETSMDLLLWRHAEAEDGIDDMKRRLTARGENQARAVARWLNEHGPKKMRILVSPTTRTRQTADALGQPYEVVRQLQPGASAADLLAASGWPEGPGGRQSAVLIVGHQPSLGQLAALLMAGAEADWTIKKGALWWFSNRVRGGQQQTVLQAVTAPDLC